MIETVHTSQQLDSFLEIATMSAIHDWNFFSNINIYKELVEWLVKTLDAVRNTK